VDFQVRSKAEKLALKAFQAKLDLMQVAVLARNGRGTKLAANSILSDGRHSACSFFIWASTLSTFLEFWQRKDL
jgi:hypothetical protein